MRDYRLYHFYVLEYGLTFLPKGLDGETWEVATELMIRALSKEGPTVTHDLITKNMAQGTSKVRRACKDAA